MLIEGLRRIARRWSFEKNKDVNWVEVLDAAARRFIADQNQKAASPPTVQRQGESE
jgi:hypothetical protein